MARPDPAHKETDELLVNLESRIASVYKAARDDLQKTVENYFESFKARDEMMKKAVDEGKVTADHYRQWRMNQIARGKRFEALRDKMARRYTQANETAVAYVNDATPGIYSLNRNYTAYTIDKATGGALTVGPDGESLNADFVLFDEQTVKRLIVESPDVMPYYPPARAVQRGIDLDYGKRQISANVTSGILRGLDINQMANELQARISSMERASAIRAARTAVTTAQNAGRQDSFDAAAKMGIHVRKRWIAFKDMRTRQAHGEADGQIVEEDKPFNVGGYKMMFPGDQSGGAPGWLIYNCRCTLGTAEKDGIEAEPRMMRVLDANGNSVVVPEMTYKEWREWVRTGKLPDKTGQKPLANGGGRGIIQDIIRNPDGTFSVTSDQITNTSIQKVPLLQPTGWSQTKAMQLQEAHRNLLRLVKDSPLGTEATAVYTLDMEFRGEQIADPKKDGLEQVSILAIEGPHISMHNHPSSEIFSPTDILQFIKRFDTNIMTVVGNNGTVYLLRKTDQYNAAAFLKNYLTFLERVEKVSARKNPYELVDVVHGFLSGVDKYGIEFITGGQGVF